MIKNKRSFACKVSVQLLLVLTSVVHLINCNGPGKEPVGLRVPVDKPLSATDSGYRLTVYSIPDTLYAPTNSQKSSNLDSLGYSDSIHIIASVSDSNGHPLSGLTIGFTATKGSVKAIALTDDWGKAYTTVRFAGEYGVGQIHASLTGDSTKSATTSIFFDSNPLDTSAGTVFKTLDKGWKIEIAALPDTLWQSFVDSAIITATVVDSMNRGLYGVEVSFATTTGSITAVATSDSAGRVYAVERYGSAGGSGKLRAFLTLDSSIADTAKFFIDTSAVQLLDRGWKIKMAALPDTLWWGVGDSVLVNATLVDAMNRDIVGVEVSFATTIGSITASSLSNSNGMVSATENFASVLGPGTIAAFLTLDPTIADSIKVIISEH